MMITAYADVHGNLPALKAVLEELERLQPTHVFNLGDCLSGPLQPAETAELMIKSEHLTVRGNHDRQLISGDSREMSEADRATLPKLGPHHLAWLATLPAERRLGSWVYACHGCPQSDLQYLLETVVPDGVRAAAPSEVLARVGSIEAEIILCGHSHQPRAVRLDDGRRVVNPGAVGLPAFRDIYPHPHSVEAGLPHARYVVLERSGHLDWRVDFRTVAYDWSAAAAMARSAGWDAWGRVLESGRI